MKKMKLTAPFVAVALVVAAINVNAADKLGASPFLTTLSSTTRVEIPAKAADLIFQAEARNQKQTTVEVVKTAIGLNASAPAVVGSIAKATPKMAAIAAATAVVLVPDQAAEIASAAAVAAPAFVGQIVESVCRALPVSFKKVATSVAEAVPGSERQVLSGISAAIPSLKKSIDQALAAKNDNVSSLASILSQVSPTEVATVPSQTAALRGPSQAAPFVPISGTPTVTTPSSGGVTPTPVNYAKP